MTYIAAGAPGSHNGTLSKRIMNVAARTWTNPVWIGSLMWIVIHDMPIIQIPMRIMPPLSTRRNPRRWPCASRCADQALRSSVIKFASVINISPDTVMVVLNVQNDSIPACPVPNSEKNMCHQYGFSANSIDASTPAAMNRASRVDMDDVVAREAELNPKYDAAAVTKHSITVAAIASTTRP